jgi:signal transduction histidine kinase
MEAVAEYARHSGAVDFGLMHINVDGSGQPFEAVFSARIGPHSDPIVVGRAIPVGQLPYFIFDKDHLDRPLAFEDFASDARITAIARENADATGIRSGVILPLVRGGELHGALSILWQEPRAFSEQELYIYLHISPVVASVFASLRAYRIEQELRQERELLFEASAAINEANSYDEIVQAVEKLDLTPGDIHLTLIRRDDVEGEYYYHVVAASERQFKVREVKFKPGSLPRFENNHRASVDVMDDIEMLAPDDPTRGRLEQLEIGFVAGYPLVMGERVLGGLSLVERDPRHFSLRDRRVFEAIGRLVVAAVERVRLGQEMAAAKEEPEFLYRLSQDFNAATTYQELMDAIARLQPDCDAVFLNLFENLDYDSASYLEVVAGTALTYTIQSNFGAHIPLTKYSIGRLVRHERFWEIEDIETDERVDPITLETWRAMDIRALMCVNLFRGDRYLGLFFFEYKRPHRASARERRLAVGIADLTLAAVERIASQVETKQAEEESAFLYQFAQEVNSATSTQEVADAVLRAYSTVEGVYIQIWEHLDYHRASYYVIAGSAVRGDTLVADRGAMYYKSTLPDFYERVRQEGIWLVEDADNDPRIDPWLRQVYASINVRATLVLPMLQGERWLASISFRYSKPYNYSLRDLRLMRGIRDVVFAAVERIESQEAMRRAYLAEQDARAESEALYRVSEDINAATTFHDIVRAVAKLDFGPGDIYLNLFENYNYEGARYFDIVATANNAFDHEGERWWISKFSLVHKFPRQGVFINENIPENPNIDDESKRQFLRLGVKSNMRVSLSLHGRWMGGLGLDSALPRSYSEREKRLMAGVGDLVAAAVERIRLQQETERAHRRAQELAAVEERNRLARELHDSVSQALYGIGLGARTAQAMWENDQTLVKESIDYVLALAEAALVEMRALIFELRPESLENEGLVTVLAKQAASLQTRHGLQVELDLGDEPALPFEVKENLYRIAREALHNIIKHAGATRVTLRLKLIDERLTLQIIDNGAGFDVKGDFPGHLGLRSMQERIDQLGGQLELWSALGQGTRLTVMLG